MKIKVSEATNLQLDWLVAKCGGYFSTVGQQPAYWESAHGAKHFITMRDDEGHGVHWTHSSTDWGEGGPILERENITVGPYHDIDGAVILDAWQAYIGWNEHELEPMHQTDGPTPLIAAMRCYVTSKLGDEVEVPGELE